MRPNNFIYLKCTGDSFYRMWIELLTPFHKLTPRERDVAARLLMQYFRLRDNVKNPDDNADVLRGVMWSKTSKKDMMTSLGMSPEHFQMTVNKLRVTGFLEGEDINPRFIPHKSPDERRLMLQIVYDWSTPEHPIKNES